MKNLVLLVTFIFLAASTDAFTAEVHTKECMQKFETNTRSAKDVSTSKKKKTKKSTVKSE